MELHHTHTHDLLIPSQGQSNVSNDSNSNSADLIDLNSNEEDIVNANNNQNGPISCLRPSTITLLSTLLNPIKIIPSEQGIPRDWRGLAELFGISSETMVFLEGKANPTHELVRLLIGARNIGDDISKTVEDLKAFLCLMDRYDVLDDAKPLFESDIIAYSQKSRTTTVEKTQVPALDTVVDKTAVTYDDIDSNRSLGRYDAFILYSDEDSDFALEIVDKMEKEYNLKMCLRDRDILPGVMFEHEVIVKLIEERCNRLLIIFSPSFLESSANQFLVSYTQALALETRQRKIIPCMYKKCDLPPSVRYSFCLNYTRQGKLWNFWERLSKSLAVSQPTFPNGLNKQLQSSSSPMTLTDPFDAAWFDAEKKSSPSNSNTPKSLTHSKSDSGLSSLLTSSSSNFDSISISSQSPILPSKENTHTAKDKSNSKKWYKKIVNSTTRKKQKAKKTLVPLQE